MKRCSRKPENSNGSAAQPLGTVSTTAFVAAAMVSCMCAVQALGSDGLIYQDFPLMSCDPVAAQDAAWLHYPRIGMP